MISHWEEFQAGPTLPLEKRMHVTLSPRNVILINGNIHDRLGNPDAVLLLFDKVNSIIGISPAPASRPNAFPIRTKGRGRHRLIWASPFCKHFGIRVDRVTAFINAEIDENGVLRLDLRSTTEITRRSGQNRKR